VARMPRTAAARRPCHRAQGAVAWAQMGLAWAESWSAAGAGRSGSVRAYGLGLHRVGQDFIFCSKYFFLVQKQIQKFHKMLTRHEKYPENSSKFHKNFLEVH
jgi:hypothetical protein